MMKTKIASRIFSVILAILCTVVIGLIFYYLWVPTINIQSDEFWCFILFNLVVFTVFSLFFNEIRKYKTDDQDDARNITVIIPALIVILFFIVLLGMASCNSQEFNETRYASLIEVTDGNFDEDIDELKSSSDVVIVDQKVAQIVGDRTLDTIQNSEWYYANDEYHLIKIGDEKYRVSSINYGGFFKYIKANAQGIPGYILVNAKTQEAKFVQLEEGIKYSPSAFGSYDLRRHLRNQYPSYHFGESIFEVDDELAPYWITSVRTPQVGLLGAKITTSVIVTNAITGESIEYAVENLPEWVDHVDSVSYLMKIVDYYYGDSVRTSYKHKYGWPDDNQYTPSIGYNSLVAKDGKVWYYTGLTLKDGNQTNVAFLLVSPRTGEVRSYKVYGVVESSAQVAAEGLVQHLEYSASFPTIVNINGVETYFMLLKDKAGSVQRYALCNVDKHNPVVVQAETLEEAIKAYRDKLGMGVD